MLRISLNVYLNFLLLILIRSDVVSFIKKKVFIYTITCGLSNYVFFHSIFIFQRTLAKIVKKFFIFKIWSTYAEFYRVNAEFNADHL